MYVAEETWSCGDKLSSGESESQNQHILHIVDPKVRSKKNLEKKANS